MEREDIKADWQHWTDQALIEQANHRPKVVMRDWPAPKGYKAQMCIRKNPDRNAGQYQEFLARALIWREDTGGIVFDYSKWVAPSHVEKKLRKALESMEQVAKLREGGK